MPEFGELNGWSHVIVDVGGGGKVGSTVSTCASSDIRDSKRSVCWELGDGGEDCSHGD